MRAVSFLVLLLFSVISDAAIDAYPFPDEELRQRYDNLIAELRCPQCLNTNLAGSDAMIAQDLRREVHRMLLEGSSDEEILGFMHERYGDFILYEPRLGLQTMLLWFGPLIFLAIAAIVLANLVRSKRAAVSLSSDDEKRLAEILGDSDRS